MRFAPIEREELDADEEDRSDRGEQEDELNEDRSEVWSGDDIGHELNISQARL